MTVSSPSAPESSGPRGPRHRAGAGRGAPGTQEPAGDRDPDPSAPFPAPRRAGRHRAPDAAPSGGPTSVPGPRDSGPGEQVDGGPGSGFRPLPPSGPAAPPQPSSAGVSSVGVPLGAVPTQRGATVPRRRPSYGGAGPASGHEGAATAYGRAGAAHESVTAGHAGRASTVAPDDDAVTVPVRRDALDRAAAHLPAPDATADPVDIPALRPLTVQRPEAPRRRPEAMASPHRFGALPDRPDPHPEVRSTPPTRDRLPWETPPVDQASSRLGLVALVTGVVGVIVGLAPWSGLLPRVLPQSALGAIPVFSLVGALLGVVGLGVGAVAMFRASETSRGLLVGVVGACAGAAAIVVGLVV